jgi:hypothetical protein
MSIPVSARICPYCRSDPTDFLGFSSQHSPYPLDDDEMPGCVPWLFIAAIVVFVWFMNKG